MTTTIRRWIQLASLFLLLFASRNAGAVVITPCTGSPCATPGNPTNLGSVGVNQTATNSTVYLTTDTNNYTVDLVIGSCTGSATFTATIGGNATNILLKSTQNNVVAVGFTPTARGTATCTVSVYDTGTTTPLRASFTISGKGVAPVISASNIAIASPVRFADAAALHTGSVDLVITNTSMDTGQNLDVMNVTSDNSDWTITPPASTSITPNNGTKTWVLTFNPSATGSDNASITISSNDPLTPTKVVTASGTGGNAVIGVTNVDFLVVDPNTTSTTQDITISNTAASNKAPMGVTLATFENNAAGWFKFNQSGCVGTTTPCALAYSLVSNSGTVGVTCSPPANATGSQTASVTITSDADTTTNSSATLMCTAATLPTPPDAGVDPDAGTDVAPDSGIGVTPDAGMSESSDGGGCCDTGRSSGPTTFVAVLLLGLRMRRRRWDRYRPARPRHAS